MINPLSMSIVEHMAVSSVQKPTADDSSNNKGTEKFISFKVSAASNNLPPFLNFAASIPPGLWRSTTVMAIPPPPYEMVWKDSELIIKAQVISSKTTSCCEGRDRMQCATTIRILETYKGPLSPGQVITIYYYVDDPTREYYCPQGPPGCSIPEVEMPPNESEYYFFLSKNYKAVPIEEAKTKGAYVVTSHYYSFPVAGYGSSVCWLNPNLKEFWQQGITYYCKKEENRTVFKPVPPPTSSE